MIIEHIAIVALLVVFAVREYEFRACRRESETNWNRWQGALQRCIDSRAKRDKTIKHLHDRIEELKNQKKPRVIPAIALTNHICPSCSEVVTTTEFGDCECYRCGYQWEVEK